LFELFYENLNNFLGKTTASQKKIQIVFPISPHKSIYICKGRNAVCLKGFKKFLKTLRDRVLGLILKML